jgi:hypothetical protein
VALEQAGGSSLNNIIKKIKERYPDYNFDIPPEPDRECKSKFDCKGLANITYTDIKGDTYCGKRYKQTSEDNPYKWEYRECHALLKEKRQGGEQEEIPF